MQLPDDIAESLLQRLASDDAFRATFEKDPSAALAELGYSGDTPCLAVRQLAGKDAIRAAHTELRRVLTSAKGSAIPIALEAARR